MRAGVGLSQWASDPLRGRSVTRSGSYLEQETHFLTQDDALLAPICDA